MRKLKGHLTYANVVATLALVLAVAGGSTAIAISTKIKKNSVGAKQIKKGAIKPSKLADDAVTNAKIADGAVTSAKLAPIHVVTTVGSGSNPTDTRADCANPGERLLSGGGSAIGGGSLFLSIRSGLAAPGWHAAATPPATTAVAQAFCLSAIPSG